jgi:hypothetical protein
VLQSERGEGVSVPWASQGWLFVLRTFEVLQRVLNLGDLRGG